MGTSSSKLKTRELEAIAFEAQRKEEVEARNRLLQKAYEDGQSDASFQAMRAMEAQRNEDLMLGACACFFTALSTAMLFGYRAGNSIELHKQQLEQSSALAVQVQQDLNLERQRVRELATINDSQSEMIKSQANLVEKTREQTASLRARLQFMRLHHLKLKRKHQHLMVEASTLRAQNGVLHQRFIASTSGAIFMACVAGGFAIASHGSASHGPVAAVDVHNGSGGAEPSASVPVVGVAPANGVAV